MKKIILFFIFAVFLFTITACSTTHSIGSKVTNDITELNSATSMEEYHIGNDDLLGIKVFQADELSQEVRVDANGNINLPLLKTILVAGLTQIEAEEKIEDLLRQNLLQDPQVTIFIKEFTNRRITVEGEVNKPGVYPITGKMTILQALAIAQGPTNFADLENTMLFRQNNNSYQTYLINLKDIKLGTNKDFFLRNDDKIVIRRSDSRYWLKEYSTYLSPLLFFNGLAN